jgi:hypothetical protein
MPTEKRVQPEIFRNSPKENDWHPMPNSKHALAHSSFDLSADAKADATVVGIVASAFPVLPSSGGAK